MGRMIVLLLATIAVWVSVGTVMIEMTVADNGTILILGIIAFLSTAVIWAVGGNIAVAQRHTPRRAEDRYPDYAKPKRASGETLSSVVDTLSPEQLASLEIALQRRRDSYDEDEQILANRLSAEYSQTSQ